MSGPTIRVVPNRNFRPPDINLNFKAILLIVLALVIAFAVFDMFFTIQPEEVGVVLTFGKFTELKEPGLRFKLPRPIQQVMKVPVQRQLKQEFGFRTTSTRTSRTTYDDRDLTGESLMLTGDLNVLQVTWITQYRIGDPKSYLFKVDRITDTFRDMNEAIMRSVVGDRSVNEVLTVGRQEIASEVEVRLQELCDQYETGIRIDQVVLQDVTPPDEVADSFNEVNQAQQEREKLINEARRDFNKEVPRARGEALKMVEEAEGYATDRVNRAQGDAALFNEVMEAYRRAPDVTRRRIYLETMQELLPRVDRKIVIDEDIKGLLPLLNLDAGKKP